MLSVTLWAVFIFGFYGVVESLCRNEVTTVLYVGNDYTSLSVHCISQK